LIAGIVLPVLLTVGCSNADGPTYQQGYANGSIGMAATLAANAGDPIAACQSALRDVRSHMNAAKSAGTSALKDDQAFLRGCHAALNARYG
jgi:hypothetical protein